MALDKNFNIVLIGMPASGKSTMGVLLARYIGFDFVDLDILIQTGEKRSLQEIITEQGMEAFLRMEEEYLIRADYSGFVIAPGGSAVYSARGMAHLAEKGIMVYLKLGLEHLEKRLLSLDARGVVRSPDQDIKALFAGRKPLYEKYADITIECDNLSLDQMVSALKKELSSGIKIIKGEKNE